MSALLAELNHEIRTAMNAVVGTLDVLLDSGLPSPQQELASTAQYSAENLLDFVQTFVDLALAEAGQIALEPHPFELSAEIEAAAAVACSLDIQPPQPLPAVLLQGDRLRVRQIFICLLRIASHASDSGSTAHSAVKADYLLGQACNIRVEVDATKLAKASPQLLELIERPGTEGVEILLTHGRPGLDISLCKQLARLMDGRVFIEQRTAADCALCFEAALPLAVPSLASERLLVVDAHDEDRHVLEELFTRHGMRVEAFSSMGTALEALPPSGSAPYRAAIIGRDVHGLDAALLGPAFKSDRRMQSVQLVALCDDDAQASATVQAGFAASITRPLSQAAALAAMNAVCSGESGSVSPVPTRVDEVAALDFTGRRILVADDNLVNQQVAQRMLERLGCRVDVAADGRQALAMHKAHPYDLILMDCQMPVMDGREAAIRLRALEGAAGRTPIVALTASATQPERARCLAAGMDDFLAKPIRPRTLAAAMAKWFVQPASTPPAEEFKCTDELEQVQDMFGADFAELASLYQADSPARIANLRAAGNAGDGATVARFAHALSGSSASIGATGLSSLCKELEMRANTDALEDIEQRLVAIEAEYSRVCHKLQFLIKQP